MVVFALFGGDLLPGRSLIPLIFFHPSQGCCELVSYRDTSVCAGG